MKILIAIIMLLVVAGLAASLLAGCIPVDNAAANRARAQAELVAARADAEHQRAVDGMDRYALHTATLAAFLGSDDATLLLVLVSLVAGCLMALLGRFIARELMRAAGDYGPR